MLVKILEKKPLHIQIKKYILIILSNIWYNILNHKTNGNILFFLYFYNNLKN